MEESLSMTTTSAASEVPVLTALLGESAALQVLADRKPTVVEQTQATHDALYAAEHPLPASLLHTLAAVVAVQHGSRALLTWHLSHVEDRALFDELVAGDTPADPLLAALVDFLDTVSVSPALAEAADQDALAAAGADPDLVVLIGQLVAFESYLIRLVAGLAALDPAAIAGRDLLALPASGRTPHSRGREGERSELTRDANWVASDVTALAAGQDERWTALIESAARLAALAPQFDETDAKRLRDLGLAELEIVDHVASTAFFGWANRLMLTLGEPYWPTAEATS